MPQAVQHNTIFNVPELGLVLNPGVPLLVTQAQADALEKRGVTIIPDSSPDNATHPTED